MAKFGLISLFLLFFCCPLCAQQKQEISREELARIYRDSIEKIRGRSVRLTSLTETRSNSTNAVVHPSWTESPSGPPRLLMAEKGSERLYIHAASKTILEISAAGAYHMIIEAAGNPLLTKAEKIGIDGKTYTRDPNNRWSESQLIFSVPPIPAPELPEKGQFSFLGTEVFSGRPVKVYQGTDKQTAGSKLVSTTLKFRITEDGDLIQTELTRRYAENSELSGSKDISPDQPIKPLLPAEAAERGKEARRQATSRAYLPPVRTGGPSIIESVIMTNYDIDLKIKVEAPGK